MRRLTFSSIIFLNCSLNYNSSLLLQLLVIVDVCLNPGISIFKPFVENIEIWSSLFWKKNRQIHVFGRNSLFVGWRYNRKSYRVASCAKLSLVSVLLFFSNVNNSQFPQILNAPERCCCLTRSTHFWVANF